MRRNWGFLFFLLIFLVSPSFALAQDFPGIIGVGYACKDSETAALVATWYLAQKPISSDWVGLFENANTWTPGKGGYLAWTQIDGQSSSGLRVGTTSHAAYFGNSEIGGVVYDRVINGHTYNIQYFRTASNGGWQTPAMLRSQDIKISCGGSSHPSPTLCPLVNKLFECPPNSEFIPGGNGSDGCQLPDKCVPVKPSSGPLALNADLSPCDSSGHSELKASWQAASPKERDWVGLYPSDGILSSKIGPNGAGYLSWSWTTGNNPNDDSQKAYLRNYSGNQKDGTAYFAVSPGSYDLAYFEAAPNDGWRQLSVIPVVVHSCPIVSPPPPPATLTEISGISLTSTPVSCGPDGKGSVVFSWANNSLQGNDWITLIPASGVKWPLPNGEKLKIWHYLDGHDFVATDGYSYAPTGTGLTPSGGSARYEGVPNGSYLLQYYTRTGDTWALDSGSQKNISVSCQVSFDRRLMLGNIWSAITGW
ncbi:MAG: hypothetical protein AAB597_02680 [Patescibacteria group bacterium]